MTQTQRLTSMEEDAIEELRCRIRNSLTPKLQEDSSLFYRFLKARNFNVDKAEKMLLKHINWRKIYQVDTILDDFIPRQYFTKYILPLAIGVDKDGDIVLYASSGKCEPADSFKCDTMRGISRTYIWLCERNINLLRKQSEETGRQCTQLSFIIDLEGLTLSTVTNKASSDTWLLLTNLFQDNYPERMKAVFVINGGWKEAFLKAMDADVLPAFLGGTRTDPDGNPLCPSFVNHGGKIPPEYYLPDEERYFKDKSQVKAIVVPPAEKIDICVDVVEKGSRLRWEFFVKCKDIKFGLSFQSGENNEAVVIIPLEKYCTADGKEMSSHRTLAAGKYIITFDNSYSWRNTKEIEYRVKVTKPE